MNRRRFFIAATATVSEMNAWFFNEVARHTQNFDTSLLLAEHWQIDVLAPFSIPKASQDVLLDIDPHLLMHEAHDHFLKSVTYLV